MTEAKYTFGNPEYHPKEHRMKILAHSRMDAASMLPAS